MTDIDRENIQFLQREIRKERRRMRLLMAGMIALVVLCLVTGGKG